MLEQLIGDSEALRAIVDFLAWSWPYVFTALYMSIAAAASAHVVLYKRDVRSAVAWAGLIWLSPFIGAALYVFFGINRLQRRATRLRTDEEETDFMQGASVVEPRKPPEAEIRSPRAAEWESYEPLRRFIGTVSNRRLTAGNEVVALRNGDEGYPAMLDAIRNAQRSIAMCTYIFDNDRAGKQFVEALGAAVDRGVDVRVLIDGVGARYSRPRITGLLKQHNVPTAKFLENVIPFRNPYVNLRNHRKILVTDGAVGFTGGLNIREGCVLALGGDHPVQDTHFRFEGPVVRHLMEDFADDWEFTTDEVLEGDQWFPEIAPAGTVEARGIADGPDENFESIQWAFKGGLAAARDSVRIMTPYFIPNQTLISALSLTAMRGVSVQIILPEKGNLKFVQWAQTAQLWQVLVHGCEVHLSPEPFDHSKLMVVDSHWATMGSANWDPRSLRLNFEFNVECYDTDLASNINALIDEKLKDCRQLSLDDVNGRSLPIKLRDGVARLFSPYL